MSDSWPWGIGQVGSGSEGESLMEVVVVVGIGWFASERHTYRRAVYGLKESAHPGRASPCRASKAWDEQVSEAKVDTGLHYSSIFVLCNLQGSCLVLET